MANALALTSALCLAGATILIRQGLRGSNPYAGFWINLAVGAAGLWLAVAITGGFRRVSLAGLSCSCSPGSSAPVGGRLLRFISIEQVGAAISAALTNTTP